jgi:sortase (surface protein transpeptidase)
MPLGLQSDGSLQVPPNAYLTGWFTGGPRPGEIGPSVIAGHVHWNDRWGVFERLSEMLPGDLISVIRADSTTITFRVTRVSHFKKTRFPTDLVYGNVDYVALRLITCSGYSSGRRAYLYNVVVFARSVDIPNAPIRTG